ncbi:integrase_H2C2 domain-containing protein [Trichonephila inaurata madagascariensis]|uniref:Integrase_H2C2 domain-containing protein n=1 Tax=Trichonephila inaurata madagascariensis TaxID=2747483 RepID=A0A8X6YQ40_9ARAC|nr:integrase_H2C2 domain-containing protein [Trichonephila inaurata madagascariensis]
MDLERLKTKQSTVRSLFTKLVTKINANIETPVNEEINREIKLEILQGLKCQLVEKIKDLKELDFDIEKVVDISDLEKEIMDSEKYRETGTIVRSKLDSEWLDFHNSFEIAIHKNDTLSKIEKFTYLKSYLRGAASTAISGFALTNENYDSAIQLLQDRFGRKELAINAHMTKLIQLETVKSVNNVPALRKLYDNIEVQVRSLQSLGIRTETYSNFLFPVILQKVPLKINILYNRQRKCDATDINCLICFLKQEIQSCETAFSMSNSNSFASEPNRRQTLKMHSPQNYPNKSNFNSSHAMVTHHSQPQIKCVFCFKNNKSDTTHISEDCPLDLEQRKNAIKLLKKCFICFGNFHITRNCKKKYLACKCRFEFHHNKLICEFLSTPNKTKNQPLSCEDEHDKQPESEGQTTLSTLVDRNDLIFLQIFVAQINSIKIRGLIDTGSSKLFVLKRVVDLLQLKSSSTEELIIYAFGLEGRKQSFDIVKLKLQSIFNSILSIDIRAAVTDKITHGRISVPSGFVAKIALKKGLILADDGFSTEIDLLIGSDFICEILGDRNLKISKRLMATNSIFG